MVAGANPVGWLMATLFFAATCLTFWLKRYTERERKVPMNKVQVYVMSAIQVVRDVVMGSLGAVVSSLSDFNARDALRREVFL
jgi:hypothetical protein